jgi:hypothetical protein
MYLVFKQDGSFTSVVRRETIEAAITSVKAFADTHDLTLEIHGDIIEAVDGNRIPETKAWVELEPYKNVELKK